MAKGNKLRKKRLKRYMQQRSKQTKLVAPKEVTPAQQFQTKLNEVYGGSIEALNRYVSDNAVLCFKCHSCGVRFFGRPSHMVGEKHQLHLCGMPYGDRHGERLEKLGGVRLHKSKTNVQKIEQQFNEMIWNDFTYQEIAQKLQVNPNLIKWYFETEGIL